MSVPLPPEPVQLLPLEAITHRIAVLRGQKVLLDSDLAALYGVETKRFNEQVKRNAERFPQDFMFELTAEEFEALRSQFATSNATASAPAGRGGRRYLPRAFTEHGAIMAATVLGSPRAIEVSVYVVRAFVRLRELAATHGDLAKRLDELENKTEALAMQHDAFSRNRRNQLKQVFDAIRELMTPPDPPKRPLDRAFTSTLDRSMRTALQAFTGLAAVLLIGCASRSPPAPPPPPVEFGATDTSRRIATQLAIAQAIDKFDAALVLKGIEQLSRNDIDLQFQGEPLLVRAIRVKNDPAARLLLGAGASPIATDDRGNTPLHWAMYRNLSQLVAHLREQGVDENVRNLDGRLPVELGEIGLVEEAWLVAARSASPTDASRALAFIFQKGDLAQVALSRASYTPGARRPLAELVISHGMASMVETIEGFLRSKEDRGLAELYLNSGSERLAEYARRWAAVNGYEVRRSDRNESSSSVRWGKTTR